MREKSFEPVMEMFIFETYQLLEQLEQIIISSEKGNSYSSHHVNEIFRIMHTIKGSSAMMMFNGISVLSHSMEDLFYIIRENKPQVINFTRLTDLILKGADFIRTEITKIEGGNESDADSSELIDEIQMFLADIKNENSIIDQKSKKLDEFKFSEEVESVNEVSAKNAFKAVVHFEEGCQMENIRAFGMIHNLKEIASSVRYFPLNIIEDNDSAEIIRKDGFKIFFKTDFSIDMIHQLLTQTVFLKNLILEELDGEEEIIESGKQEKKAEDIQADTYPETINKEQSTETQSKHINQSMISVNVSKLDKLMDLMGELVISEAMVIQNSDLQGLVLENFNKAARQLSKITGELQESVMSIRMVPLSATLQKTNRIIRDMCKKLDKEVNLEIYGEETEVDKNIIEHISDPLMHIIRNSIDHGIESTDMRVSAGKDKVGKIILGARNAGGDVLISIRDDGRGLDKEKILERARDRGLLQKPESELTEREIYSFIFLPGFSTKENVSEFSGRGVGMDVVTKNIEKVGGIVNVDSIPNEGTTVTIRIPLTLAIIGGMNIRVGKSIYTIPIISIKESFRPGENDIFKDPEGNEMIMIRGLCYPVIRLHRLFNVKTDVVRMNDGIIIMVENNLKTVCIFADALLGEQQVVVKTLPNYIKKVKGLTGCTLLGDGSISLILDITNLAGG